MRSESAKHLAHGKPDSWNTCGVLLPESILAGRLDFASTFGNARPVEVEIGTGKGTFLLARATARPELNFLGVEWANAYCRYAADRFRRAGLTNVRMLRADAGELFRRVLPEKSVWRVHVYFPDPWPKRRHHRRRLIQLTFVEQMRRALQVGGQLVIVTDHGDYFRHIARVLLHAEGLAVVPMPRMADSDGEWVGTNFERKYIAQGRRFYRVARLRYA